MTSQRFALSLFVAALTSSWWALATWGMIHQGVLMAPCVILTGIALVAVIIGVMEDDK
jgi:hypothetical protein